MDDQENFRITVEKEIKEKIISLKDLEGWQEVKKLYENTREVLIGHLITFLSGDNVTIDWQRELLKAKGMAIKINLLNDIFGQPLRCEKEVEEIKRKIDVIGREESKTERRYNL